MITTKQYNKLLNVNEELNNKNIKLIKKVSIFKFSLGAVCLAVAIIPNGAGIVFYPLSFMLMGLSLFDIRTKYLPETFRQIKNKVLRR